MITEKQIECWLLDVLKNSYDDCVVSQETTIGDLFDKHFKFLYEDRHTLESLKKDYGIYMVSASIADEKNDRNILLKIGSDKFRISIDFVEEE